MGAEIFVPSRSMFAAAIPVAIALVCSTMHVCTPPVGSDAVIPVATAPAATLTTGGRLYQDHCGQVGQDCGLGGGSQGPTTHGILAHVVRGGSSSGNELHSSGAPQAHEVVRSVGVRSSFRFGGLSVWFFPWWKRGNDGRSGGRRYLAASVKSGHVRNGSGRILRLCSGSGPRIDPPTI